MAHHSFGGTGHTETAQKLKDDADMILDGTRG